MRDLWKQGHVVTGNESGSFYSINCHAIQIALTETPNLDCPRFTEDAKYNTELYQGLPKLEQSLESIAPLCIGCILGKFHRPVFRPTAKGLHGCQRPDGYDVHRKTSSLSDIIRRLFRGWLVGTRYTRNRMLSNGTDHLPNQTGPKPAKGPTV